VPSAVAFRRRKDGNREAFEALTIAYAKTRQAMTISVPNSEVGDDVFFIARIMKEKAKRDEQAVPFPEDPKEHLVVLVE
jgi:hypothetical protein